MRPHRSRRPLLLASGLLAVLVAGPAAAAEILACAAKDKIAVGPLDPLDCQWKEDRFGSTLQQLYSEQWRLIDAEFFNGNREILYLEKP